MVELVLAATATALATGLGAIPVSLLGSRAIAFTPALLAFAAGVMSVASIAGLIMPGLDEGSVTEVGAGFAAGIAFLFSAKRLLAGRPLSGGERPSASLRTAVLVFTVLFVHSLPEGFAVGTAYASETDGLALFVILAIGLQNIPEGTSVAIPMEAAGYSASRQFWAAVLTSAPQPIGAVIAYLAVEQVTALLPISFGFAAGAMLTLVVIELIPDSLEGPTHLAVLGGTLGVAVMLALSFALGL